MQTENKANPEPKLLCDDVQFHENPDNPDEFILSIEASMFYFSDGESDAPANRKLSLFRGGRRQHLRIAETILRVLEPQNEGRIHNTLLRIEKSLHRIENLLDSQSGSKSPSEPPSKD